MPAAPRPRLPRTTSFDSGYQRDADKRRRGAPSRRRSKPAAVPAVEPAARSCSGDAGRRGLHPSPLAARPLFSLRERDGGATVDA